MELKKLPYDLTICKVANVSKIDLEREFFFLCRTDEEISLVCPTEYTPSSATVRDDGWKGFRICGVLDFSLIGILAELSGILARNGISIFAVSMYNTDYVLVKADDFENAVNVLAESGYTVL